MQSPSHCITTASIAALAYRFWQERGCPEGSPEVDWLRAEEQLLASARRQPDSLLIALARSIGAWMGVAVSVAASLFISVRSHRGQHESGASR